MVLYDLTLCHACMWPNFDNFIQPLPIRNRLFNIRLGCNLVIFSIT